MSDPKILVHTGNPSRPSERGRWTIRSPDVEAGEGGETAEKAGEGLAALFAELVVAASTEG